jgi:hypothetical protein
MDGVLGVAAGFGGIAQIASIGSAFWLGGRLLRRAQRSGGVPERLLGLHLLLAIGVGSLLLTIATTSRYGSAPVSPLVHVVLAIAGNLATIAGLMAALWFNYHVFHEGQRGGRWVAHVVTALMCATFVIYVFAGGMEPGGELYGPASWPYCGAMVLGDLWLISDALRFRGQLLRRLRLGLAEPLVVDRLLLWSIASLARVALVLIAPLTTVLFGSTTALRASLVSPMLGLSALLILGATVSLWLMLAPSAGYRRWVERRYARTS